MERGVFLTLELPDSDATEKLGRRLAPCLAGSDVVALAGPLGAGKTALARAVIRALPGPPGSDAEEVPSPTFSLLQIYERLPAPVWHFDLYRLEREDEVWELGWEEAQGSAIVLVEWPERLGSLLPPDALRLSLAIAGSGRRAAFAGPAPWPTRLEALGHA